MHSPALSTGNFFFFFISTPKNFLQRLTNIFPGTSRSPDFDARIFFFVLKKKHKTKQSERREIVGASSRFSVRPDAGKKNEASDVTRAADGSPNIFVDSPPFHNEDSSRFGVETRQWVTDPAAIDPRPFRYSNCPHAFRRESLGECFSETQLVTYCPTLIAHIQQTPCQTFPHTRLR